MKQLSVEDALLDPTTVPFTHGDRADIRGHLRPAQSGPVDPAWLTMATDWFPPPAFIRIGIETSAAGLAVEHGRITRSDGSLVAESFQTRWTAEG